MGTELRALLPISGNFFFTHAKDAYHRIPPKPTFTTGGQTEALTSIVFAASALEAFINELADFTTQPVYAESPEPPLPAFAGLMEELEKSRASIVSKFWLGKWVLSAMPYDKGAQPYQDFALLIELRNTLVHSRSLDKLDLDSTTGAWVRTIDTPAPAIISKLASKHILAEFTKSAVAWPTLLTTKATAQWACNAASAIVLSFLESLPNGKYSNFIRKMYYEKFSGVE
jgi:hypothetical protein